MVAKCADPADDAPSLSLIVQSILSENWNFSICDKRLISIAEFITALSPLSVSLQGLSPVSA